MASQSLVSNLGNARLTDAGRRIALQGAKSIAISNIPALTTFKTGADVNVASYDSTAKKITIDITVAQGSELQQWADARVTEPLDSAGFGARQCKLQHQGEGSNVYLITLVQNYIINVTAVPLIGSEDTGGEDNVYFTYQIEGYCDPLFRARPIGV